MNRIIKKPKPELPSKHGRAGLEIAPENILPARDPLAYAAALQILG